MQRNLIDYIRRPESLNQQAVAHLQGLSDEYPYFHTVRILLLQALYKHHSPRYDKELRRSTTLLPDPASIFRLTEEQLYARVEEKRKYNSEGYEEDKSQLTSQLIDTFINSQPHEVHLGDQHPIDATQDYIGYLLQQNGEKEQPDMPLNGDGVVEHFLEHESGRIVLEKSKENEAPDQATSQPDQGKEEEGNEILTEIMAGIYIKQGKYENAIKIIRQLSLKYPKKKRYFADQIRFLEKLILNDKNK